MPGLVPGIFRFGVCDADGRVIEHVDVLAPAKMHKAVIASEAKQSIHPLCRAMDCFRLRSSYGGQVASLANDAESSVRKHLTTFTRLKTFTPRKSRVPVFKQRTISSSSSLTGYLPLSSRACLPTLLMRSAKIP
jgi:hypothetical protein